MQLCLHATAKEALYWCLQVVSAYFFGKQCWTVRRASLSSILNFLRRPTIWHWAQAWILSTSLIYATFSHAAGWYPCFILSSLLIFYAVAKLGCYNAGCCRARVDLIFKVPSLPLIELLISAFVGIFLLIALTYNAQLSSDIFMIGALSLVALRAISLLLQGRGGQEVMREFGVSVPLLGLFFLSDFT
jgi:hypothetical protein